MRRADKALTALELWQLEPKEQSKLLGMNLLGEANPYRAVAAATLAGNRDLLERCEQVYLIELHLDMLFPKDPDLAQRWMTQPNRAFNGDRPADFAIKKGLEGLKAIKSYLARA